MIFVCEQVLVTPVGEEHKFMSWMLFVGPRDNTVTGRTERGGGDK